MSSALQLLLPLTGDMGPPGCPPVGGDLNALLCQLTDTARSLAGSGCPQVGALDSVARSQLELMRLVLDNNVGRQ